MSLTEFNEVKLISGLSNNWNGYTDRVCYFGVNKILHNINNTLDNNKKTLLDKFKVNILSANYIKFYFWYEIRKMHCTTTKTFVREDKINYGKEHILYYYSVTNKEYLPIIWEGEELKIQFL